MRKYFIPLIAVLYFSVTIFSCKKANPVEPCTDCSEKPDTTSHAVNWIVDTIGIYPSYLKDVAIINDTNIWAVGNITKEPFNNYNAAHWNGKKWEKVAIQLSNIDDKGNETGGTYQYPLETIWAFSKDNIWVTNGYQIANWNGTEWKRLNPPLNQFVGSTYKLWGTNENDLYLAGSNGNITHFNGTTFTKMPTGTTNRLDDIWGTSPTNIWAVGNEPDGVLLHYNGVQWETFDHIVYSASDFEPPTDKLKFTLHSIYQFSDNDSLYVSTAWGVQKRSKLKDGKSSWTYERRWQSDPNSIGIIHRIRGIAKNDIFYVGTFNTILHYNGNSFYRYKKL